MTLTQRWKRWGGLLAVSCWLLGSPTIAQRDVSIAADTIDYDDNSALVVARGNFVVRQGGVELQGDRGSYNNISGQSILVGNAALIVGNRQFQAQRLEGNHRNEIFLLEGEVQVQLATDLQVLAKAMVLRDGKASLVGPVQILSPKWQITGDRAAIDAGAIVLYDGWRQPATLMPLRVSEANPASVPGGSERVESGESESRESGSGDSESSESEIIDQDRREYFGQLKLDLDTQSMEIEPVPSDAAPE